MPCIDISVVSYILVRKIMNFVITELVFEKNTVLYSMFSFDFLDELPKIFVGLSPELMILLQISKPLCKPSNIAAQMRN
jgi:hypothetical protein